MLVCHLRILRFSFRSNLLTFLMPFRERLFHLHLRKILLPSLRHFAFPLMHHILPLRHIRILNFILKLLKRYLRLQPQRLIRCPLKIKILIFNRKIIKRLRIPLLNPNPQNIPSLNILLHPFLLNWNKLKLKEFLNNNMPRFYLIT